MLGASSWYRLPRQSNYEIIKKYLKLDPKPSDLTMVKAIKAWTGYRCKDIRWIVVS